MALKVGILALLLVPLLAMPATTASASAGARGLSWTAAQLQRVHLPVQFVAAPQSFLLQCRRTAQAAHESVPCPERLPQGLQPTSVGGGLCSNYEFKIIGLPCSVALAWKGWLVGSVQSGSGASFQHLVINISPTPTDYVRAINGPTPTFPKEGPRLGGWIAINGQRMRWVYVDPEHNPGSAFMGHVVLVWTQSRHTYAMGFHAVTSMQIAAAMDYQLVRHLKFVR